MFYIYKITNTKNGKFYIGKTSDLDGRWSAHKSKSKNGKTYFYKAICKYGEDAFDMEVIDSHENEDVAYALEKHWIEKLGSNNPEIGYNLAEGGKGGFCGVIPNEDSRQKMSEASKTRKRKPHTKETKQKLKEARTKQNRQLLDINLKNQILGMYRTNNYTKQQVADRFSIGINTVKSVIRQGVGLEKFEPYVMPEERRKQISESLKGREVTDEVLANLDYARSKIKYGPLSDEHKDKISKSLNEIYKISDDLKNSIISDFEMLLPKKEIAEKNGVSIDCVDKVTKGINRVSPLTGRIYSDKHKEKISKANIGRVVSIESRKKISESNSGDSNGMYGRTHSAEARIKMSKKQKERTRLPVSDEQKKLLSLKFQGKPRPPRIPDSIKEGVRTEYKTGKFTKRQLADKYSLKYNSIVNILR